MTNIDLNDVPILGPHTHPYQLEELLARPTRGSTPASRFAGVVPILVETDNSTWPLVDELTRLGDPLGWFSGAGWNISAATRMAMPS